MARGSRQKYITKKHRARIERERLQTRLIMSGAIIVVVLAIGLIGYGALNEAVLKPLRPIATVGKDKISIKEFQDDARYSRLQIINNYVQLAQLFGNDTSAQSYLQQLQSQLEPNTLGQNTLDTLIQDRLVRQEAARRNIKVSSQEVDAKLEGFFGYYANGTPTPQPTDQVFPTSTLSPLQMTLVPPTETPTASPTVVLTVTAVSKPTATLTPSPTPTSTPSGPTPTFTPEPTATPYTLAAYQKNYQDYIKQLTSIKIPEAVLRRLAESVIYQEKIENVVLADLKPEEEQVWARHILVADEATAKQVLDRLNKGEDFAKVAREMSTDTSSAVKGGDLGWFGRGQMISEFEQAAFSLKIGEISQPVKTTYGYHIIQVLGHEVRSLTTSQFDQLRQTKFKEWVDQQKTAVGVKINDSWVSLVPTDPALPTSQSTGQ